jgi:hypothetical protein
MGTLILGGWTVVGLLVAGYERSRGTDTAFETQLCVVGAIAGGFAGQVTHWYVFGEPLGFVFAIAGAELLLRSYRRRRPTGGPPAVSAPAPAPAPPPAAPAAEAPALSSTPQSPLLSGLEAFAWGVLGACFFAGAAFAGEMAAERLYALNEPHAMSLLFYLPVALVIGFVLGVRSCLKEPRPTIAETLVFLALAASAFGAVVIVLGKADAPYEHGLR